MGELIRRKYTVYRLDRVANRVRTCPERVSAVYISVRGCATVYDSLLAGITASQLPFYYLLDERTVLCAALAVGEKIRPAYKQVAALGKVTAKRIL